MAYKHALNINQFKTKYHSSFDPMTPYIYTVISLLPCAKNSLSELLMFTYFTFSLSLLTLSYIFFYHCTETGLNEALNDLHFANSIVYTLQLLTSFDTVDLSLKYFLLIFLIQLSLGFLSSSLVSTYLMFAPLDAGTHLGSCVPSASVDVLWFCSILYQLCADEAQIYVSSPDSSPDFQTHASAFLKSSLG